MFVVLKIVHLLCLAVALGMTSANLIMMRYVKSVDPAAWQEFGPLGRSFGAFGVMAIALLWITGIALFLLKYDLTTFLDHWILTKLLLVVILTGMVISTRTMGANAIKAGTPVTPELMRNMTLGILSAGVLTVASAVVAFN
jgi:uncharacterized membrane protein SirB2